MAEELILADHAEMWWEEQGNEVPDRETAEWQKMYEKWVEFAFADIRN